jgi:hypothetical protein
VIRGMAGQSLRGEVCRVRIAAASRKWISARRRYACALQLAIFREWNLVCPTVEFSTPIFIYCQDSNQFVLVFDSFASSTMSDWSFGFYLIFYLQLLR